MGFVKGLGRRLDSNQLVVAVFHVDIDRVLSVHSGLLSDSCQLLAVQGGRLRLERLDQGLLELLR